MGLGFLASVLPTASLIASICFLLVHAEGSQIVRRVDLYLVLTTILKRSGDCDACQHASSSKPDHPSRRVNICTGHVGATNQRIQNRCSTAGAPKIDHGKTHAVSFPDSAVLIRKIIAKMELCGWLPSTEGSGSSGPTLCVHGSDRLLSDPLSGSKHL